MWERGIWLPESPIPPLLPFFAWCMCSDVGIALGRGKDLTDWIKVYSMCVCWGSWLMLLEGWKDGWVDGEMDGGRMSDPGPVEGYENSKTQRKRKKNIRGEDMETEEYWAQRGIKTMGLNILTWKSQMKIICFGQYYDMNLFAKALVFIIWFSQIMPSLEGTYVVLCV